MSLHADFISRLRKVAQKGDFSLQKNTQSLGNFYIFLHAAPNAVYNS